MKMWWKFILQRKSKCGKIQVQKEGGDADAETYYYY